MKNIYSKRDNIIDFPVFKNSLTEVTVTTSNIFHPKNCKFFIKRFEKFNVYYI